MKALLCLVFLVAADTQEIGIDEKLGGYVPLGLTFSDESGAPVRLKRLVTKPTILSLVYYHCGGVCDTLLGGLAESLDALDMAPGRDYSVLSVSFDPDDTPADARRKKKEYLKMMKKKFSDGAWKFLTGDRKNISALTSSVGFRYKKERDEFLHPVSMIILSPSGEIVRYMPGVSFLPVDLTMALTEASEGRIGATIRKALSFCYTYEPRGKRYVVNVLRLSGAVLILLIVLFVIFSKPKRRDLP